MKILERFLTPFRNRTALQRKIKELHESEKKYRLIMEYAPLGVFHFDHNARITTCNDNFVSIIGSSTEALIGLNMFELPDKKIIHSIQKALEGYSAEYEGDYHSVTADKVTPVRVLFAPLIEEDEQVAGGVGLVEDITERRTAELEKEKSEAKYKEIMETIEDGYYEVDLNGTIIDCNQAAARMLGYTTDELLGMSYKLICKDHEAVFRAFNKAFKTGQPKFSVAMEMICKDSSTACADLSLSLTYDQEGNINGFLGLGRDITERIKLEEQLKYLSFHDQLTGLYNRLYFENELERLEGSRDYPISIVVIDVDGLKKINDTMGHTGGDKILKSCADIVSKSLRSSDRLARFGGDEFVAILPATNSDVGRKIVNRIVQNVDHYNQSNPEIPLDVSVGVHTAYKSGDSLKETLKAADKKMYREKFSKKKKSIIPTSCFRRYSS